MDAAVGDQVRSGSFAIDTSQLREAPMCSGIPVARAIQQFGERIRAETTVPLNDEYLATVPAPPSAGTLGPTRTAPSGGTGRITGEFDFPSDYIPDDIIACAEPVSGGRELCSGKARRAGGNVNYSITVPAGRYRVYARTVDSPGEKAYYSQEVLCSARSSSSVHCNDHTPIVVDVKAGGVRSAIDPNDWYAP